MESETITLSDLNLLIEADPYHVPRKKPTDTDLRLYLREVDYHCPLCGRELQSRTQRKVTQKQFEIAHIYPNRPTIQQYLELHGLERLGNTSEDYENKIALCCNCHNTQDYHTTKEEYERLLSIKKKLLERSALHDAVNELSLEKELEDIVNVLRKTTTSELVSLRMEPVRLAAKFEDNDALLLARITGYVSQYYTFIRELFREKDGKDGFVFTALCLEVKAAFLKMDAISSNKEEIFMQLSSWIKRKVPFSNQTACEIIAAFFVQNCEVFNEIAQ